MNLQLSIISGLGVLIMMLSAYGYSEHTQKVSCHDKAKLASAMAEEAKKKFDRDIKSYEYAIDEITAYFDKEKSEVDNFERGKDETECDAANRLLNGFKY